MAILESLAATDILVIAGAIAGFIAIAKVGAVNSKVEAK